MMEILGSNLKKLSFYIIQLQIYFGFYKMICKHLKQLQISIHSKDHETVLQILFLLIFEFQRP